MDIEKIQNAFSPAREITDPEFFVGRHEEIKNSVLALSEKGSFIAIHGLRGVGKSSIAKQLKLIAEGEKTLARTLNFERFIPRKGFQYLTLYTACDTFTKNTTDVLKRIIFGDNESGGLLSFTSSGNKKN
jgi:AAA+ ATPase superfamily predicted ATPase